MELPNGSTQQSENIKQSYYVQFLQQQIQRIQRTQRILNQFGRPP